MAELSLESIIKNDFSAFHQKQFSELLPSTEFLENWHQQAMSHELKNCLTGIITRLIITMPPRNGKSLMAVVATITWALAHNPSERIILVSYSDDVIKKHMRDIKQIMKCGWFQKAYPNCKISVKKNTETEFETTMNGGVFATTIGGSLTGLGADLIIIDDPMKPADMFSELLRSKTNDWYKSTLITRLNNKKTGRIIIIMQRLHQDDLVGHVLPLDNWSHLNLPAINDVGRTVKLNNNQTYFWPAGESLHPEREDLDDLAKLKKTMGTLVFSSQYLQQPMPAEGNMVKEEWFTPFDPSPHLVPEYFIQTWDTATQTGSNNDYSVCLTWGILEGKAYLANVFREKVAYPQLLETAINLANQYKPQTILVEEANVGYALISQLAQQTNFHVMGAYPKHSKEERLAAGSHIVEQGRIYLAQKNGAWNKLEQKFVDEITGFPNTVNDDQVDAFSLFLRWFIVKGPAFMAPTPGGFSVGPDGIKNF